MALMKGLMMVDVLSISSKVLVSGWSFCGGLVVPVPNPSYVLVIWG